MNHQRSVLRVAALIRNQIAQRQQDGDPVCLPEQPWANMKRLIRQIALAKSRGWHRAARLLNENLLREIQYCRDRLLELVPPLKERAARKEPPKESEIYREIVALEEEFDTVECDPTSADLWVTTEPIVLEGIDLGRFDIRLDWNRSSGSSPYRVVALEPHSAAANDGVTHPHVQDEHLCEGEGRAAIRAALDNGRLGDFFLIVSRLLATYASGSAFVELDDWEGISCPGCGEYTSEDDRSCCETCGDTLCSGCLACCQGCDMGYCSGCISACEACCRDFCGSCLNSCSECGKQLCLDCLTEKTLCEKCHEKHQQQEQEAAEHSAAVEPCVAAEPDGVGQAALSA